MRTIKTTNCFSYVPKPERRKHDAGLVSEWPAHRNVTGGGEREVDQAIDQVSEGQVEDEQGGDAAPLTEAKPTDG